MNMIRRFFSCLLVVILFLFGMLIADKQYIDTQVIGFQYSDQLEGLMLDQIQNLIRTGEFSDKDMLIDMINNTADYDVVQVCYDEIKLDGKIVPAGVYDTINVNQSEGSESKQILLCSRALSDRFQIDKCGWQAVLQRAYLWLLSLIGKIEIFLIKFFSCTINGT